MRADEELAKDKVLELLTVDYGPIGVRSGDEPPDYYFTIQGQDFAVEVTSLHQKSEQRGKVVSRHGQEVAVQRWLKSIEKKALERGVLRGTYVIGFFGDLTRMLENRSAAEGSLLEYLASTQDTTTIDHKWVYLVNGMKLGVSKHLVGKNRLFISTGITGWPTEIQTNADRILWNALGEKRRKLSGVALPCILVFHNWYPLAGPENYSDSLFRNGDTFFQGVYLIDEGNCTALRRLSLPIK